MYKIINKKKLIATIILDTVGKILFAIPRFFVKPEKIAPERVQTILIIRTAYIGDVVMTLPMLKVLKNKFPNARITFLTSKAAQPLLNNNPYVDEILSYDPFWFYKTGILSWLRFIKKIRQRRFDLVIEARADIRDLALIVFFCKAHYKISYDIGGGGYLLSHVVPYPGLTHKVDFHLHLASYLGCSLDNIDGGLYLKENEQQAGFDILTEEGVDGAFIAVHPGSRLILKRWPLDRCAHLYDELIEVYNMPIVLLGSPGEIAIVETIQRMMKHDSVSLAGRVGLRDITAVIEKATVFICNDSAPMHIAAAMGTATVAIFGPSKSFETGPYDVLCRVVENEMSCRNSCDESHCLSSHFHACMDNISQQDVMRAVGEILN